MRASISTMSSVYLHHYKLVNAFWYIAKGFLKRKKASYNVLNALYNIIEGCMVQRDILFFVWAIVAC